jgi:hypothetical protein
MDDMVRKIVKLRKLVENNPHPEEGQHGQGQG